MTTAFLLLTAATLQAGGWLPLSQPPRTTAAAFEQGNVSVASDGFDFFSVWTTSTPRGLAVYGTKISSNGTLAGEIAVPLDPQAQWASGVSITRGRDGYFMSWLSDAGLKVAITDASGRAERSNTLEQSTAASGITRSAWNGAAYFVASGFNGAIVGTIVDNNGYVLASNIDIGWTNTATAAVLADSSGFLLVAAKTVGDDERSDIYGRRFSSSGVAGEWFLVRSVATKVTSLSADWDGSRDVIAWSDQFGLWTTSVDPQTNATTPSRQLSTERGRVGRVLRAGSETWITYAVSGSLMTVPLTSGGPSPARRVDGMTGAADLAFNGSRLLAVAAEERYDRSPGAPDDRSDVFGTFITRSGNEPPFIVARSATDQTNGDLATDGTSIAAAWEEVIDGRVQIVANVTAGVATTPGVQISSEGNNHSPAIAYNGSNYLVVWLRARADEVQIVGRRLTRTGVLLDDHDIAIGTALLDSSIGLASDGDRWLVVWAKHLTGRDCIGPAGGTTKIYMTTVSNAGVVAVPDGLAANPASRFDERDPDVGWNGSTFVIAWTEECAFSPIGVTAASVRPDLTESRVVMQVPAIARTQPTVIGSDGVTLIAWSRGRWCVMPSQAGVCFGEVGTTEFRLIAATPSAGRRRAFVSPVASSSAWTIEGTLLSAAPAPGGRFAVFTRQNTPTIANMDAFLETIVGPGTAAIATRPLFFVEKTQALSGSVIQVNGRRSIAESMFDVTLGARRVAARNID